MENKIVKVLKVRGQRNFQLGAFSQMQGMAIQLKQHILSQKLSVSISGKDYVQVEGWQFAGGLMGLYPKIVSVQDLSTEKEKKWRADVEIFRVKDGKVVGFGTALCSNAETKKKSFDEYAVLSMAQTRAIGKAYRNLIGWVMKLAGYESTPSEEMASVVKETPKPDVKQTAKLVKDLFASTMSVILKETNPDVLGKLRDRIKKTQHFSFAQKEKLLAELQKKV